MTWSTSRTPPWGLRPEFFGADELVLPPVEARERLDAYYRHRRHATEAAHPERRRRRRAAHADLPPVEFPAELADADTIGLIYDEIDGLNFYNDYRVQGSL
jgi:hypothetical protein